MNDLVELVLPERIQEILNSETEASFGAFCCGVKYPQGEGGMFMTKEDDMWIGVDNRDGWAWTEEFTTMCDCLNWLYDRTDSQGNMYEEDTDLCSIFTSVMTPALA